MLRKVLPEDVPSVAALAIRMWDSHTLEELAEGFLALCRDEEALLLAAEAEGAIIGFAQCQLRHDYVEGTETSPVGYLEGIYVAESCRRQGYARQLLQGCEAWAREKVCCEFASDCELKNTDSLRFHLGLGFTEAGRIICFTKGL